MSLVWRSPRMLPARRPLLRRLPRAYARSARAPPFREHPARPMTRHSGVLAAHRTLTHSGGGVHYILLWQSRRASGTREGREGAVREAGDDPRVPGRPGGRAERRTEARCRPMVLVLAAVTIANDVTRPPPSRTSHWKVRSRKGSAGRGRSRVRGGCMGVGGRSDAA
jgi:hypothetical protein